MEHKITLCDCNDCKKLFSSSSAARRNAELLIKRLDHTNAWPKDSSKTIDYQNIELVTMENFLDPLQFLYMIEKRI